LCEGTHENATCFRPTTRPITTNFNGFSCVKAVQTTHHILSQIVPIHACGAPLGDLEYLRGSISISLAARMPVDFVKAFLNHNDKGPTGINARWHMFEEKHEAVMAIEAAVLPLMA
jgi:hypothetical protein